MCYSVLVETDLKKLSKEFDAEIDFESFLELYERREQGDTSFKIPRAIDHAFLIEDGEASKKIVEFSKKYELKKIHELEEKLFKKKKEIQEFKAKLAQKETKSHRKKLETAERVGAKALSDIKALQGGLVKKDFQIFQYTYAPLLVKDKKGDLKIKPFRYQMRPKGSAKEFPRNVNLFNARTDKLEERTNWKRLFGSRHGALIFKGFFEWVEDPHSKKSRVIQFFPENEKMWAPVLYDFWECEKKNEKSIFSFAVLTREPPKEVQSMGHDRCPVFPKWKHLNQWLEPGLETGHYKNIFDDLETVTYHNSWMVA